MRGLTSEQYSQYATQSPNANVLPTGAPTSSIATPVEPAEEQKSESAATSAAANVTPQADTEVVHVEEKTEYRDQFGNLLDDEQVRALSESPGVSFATKYETRTRLVDMAGNFLGFEGEDESVAPHHPDVEGGNPETGKPDELPTKDQPATADAKKDTEKERSVEEEQKHGGKPQPANEGNPEATK